MFDRMIAIWKCSFAKFSFACSYANTDVGEWQIFSYSTVHVLSVLLLTFTHEYHVYI